MPVSRSLSLRPLYAALLSLPLATTALAHPQHVHVHGLAHADVAIEGGLVEIHLRATAYDLVGFERAARDDAERQRIEQAQRQLLEHAALWHFSAAASCVAETPVLEVPATPAAADHNHAHDHGDGHDHAHGDGHDHDHAHVDWQARYRFHCANPAALRAIDARLFVAIPSLQTLEVQLIDARGARALELTPAAVRITLSP